MSYEMMDAAIGTLIIALGLSLPVAAIYDYRRRSKRWIICAVAGLLYVPALVALATYLGLGM